MSCVVALYECGHVTIPKAEDMLSISELHAPQELYHVQNPIKETLGRNDGLSMCVCVCAHTQIHCYTNTDKERGK